MTADERSVGEIERELRLRSDSGFPSASEWEYWTQRVASAAEFDVICGCQTSKGRSCALSPVRRGVCEDEVGHAAVDERGGGARQVARLQAHRAVQREPGGGDVVLRAGALTAKGMARLRGATLLGPLDSLACDWQPRRRGETWFVEYDLTGI